MSQLFTDHNGTLFDLNDVPTKGRKAKPEPDLFAQADADTVDNLNLWAARLTELQGEQP